MLRGDEGDDVFLGFDGNDTLIGGPGVDRLDLSALAAGGITVSLDGEKVAVENLTGTPGTTT